MKIRAKNDEGVMDAHQGLDNCFSRGNRNRQQVR